MQPPFICHTCKKRIVRKKDLIIATSYFRFYLFHSDCFKRQQVFISRFIPVNTLFNEFPERILLSEAYEEHPRVGHLGMERPEVTLRETKGYFRRGTEKLPLQALLSGE